LNVSRHHPRYLSLSVRERLTRALSEGIIVPQGLIAHGRGEAFDYLVGEKTTVAASKAMSVAAALLLTSDHPVISVNGNTAALVGGDIVKLAALLNSSIEVNLFHRSIQREQVLTGHLRQLGAREVLGIGKAARITISGIASPRRRVDARGIGSADTVLIPLEDGDRAEALKRAGKKVIAIDLNPLSRTSQVASITIVDNVVRAIPALIKIVSRMKTTPRSNLVNLTRNFDNHRNIGRTIREIIEYLEDWVTI
jgi:4-phosphopantoate---beta-alanine ligase